MPAVVKGPPSKLRKAPAGSRAKAAANPSDGPVKVTEQPPATGHNGQPPFQDSDEADILLGVSAITRFLRRLLDDPDFPETKTYNWLSRGYIPGGKVGTLWRGSKSAIRSHLQAPSNMPAAADEVRP